MKPYFDDGQVSLYLGDMREILPALSLTADCMIADVPYGVTSLPWDQWPDRWLEVAAAVTPSLWCFGSLRMFLEHGAEFTAARWKLSQDIIWEKHNGSGFHADRFRRVHESAAHWYKGPWGDIFHQVPTTPDATAKAVRRKQRPAHTGHIEASSYVSYDGGPRLARSVLRFPSMHGRAIHPTQKPSGLVDVMLSYACPPGGLVVDPFAGSGTVLDAARCSGRRAVGVELHEPYAEAAARRLAQASLFGDGGAA